MGLSQWTKCPSVVGWLLSDSGRSQFLFNVGLRLNSGRSLRGFAGLRLESGWSLGGSVGLKLVIVDGV